MITGAIITNIQNLYAFCVIEQINKKAALHKGSAAIITLKFIVAGYQACSESTAALS